MNETVCAQCDTRAESRWRIDLETEEGASTERIEYPLCRECWEDVTTRFAGPTPEGS